MYVAGGLFFWECMYVAMYVCSEGHLFFSGTGWDVCMYVCMYVCSGGHLYLWEYDVIYVCMYVCSEVCM